MAFPVNISTGSRDPPLSLNVEEQTESWTTLTQELLKSHLNKIANGKPSTFFDRLGNINPNSPSKPGMGNS
jgi:hypothetical protein